MADQARTTPFPRVPRESAPQEGYDRKSGFGMDHHRPGVDRDGDIWKVRSFALVRQVLQDTERTRQGAMSDNLLVSRVRPSVFFLDGEEHKELRTAIAKHFTPKTVDTVYDAVIETETDRLLGELMRAGRADVSTLSMELSVAVAARVVGLTNSRRPGMAKRISRLLVGQQVMTGGDVGLLGRVISNVTGGVKITGYYLWDFRPSVRARRRTPQDDILSLLIGRGYTDLDLLVESLTYAVAGMVTTREFISMAAWHLLERPELRKTYVAAPQPERRRILHEILRLEPNSTTLWRRTTSELVLEHDGVTHRIPAGSTVMLDMRTANSDPAAVGAEPLRLDVERILSPGVTMQALSFGSGPHKCPGAFLAIQEADLFLQRLLDLPVQLVGEPTIFFNDPLKTYEVRDLIVETRPLEQ